MWLHVGWGYYTGGCLNRLIVSNNRSAGPSFMLNLSRRWCSLSKNILCPSISYSWNESAQSVNPCSRRNSATSSGSHSLGLRVYVPSSVRCPVCFRCVERLERRGRKSEASARIKKGLYYYINKSLFALTVTIIIIIITKICLIFSGPSPAFQ